MMKNKQTTVIFFFLEMMRTVYNPPQGFPLISTTQRLAPPIDGIERVDNPFFR